MDRTLELPNGEVVTEGDVVLYNGYPYRVRFLDDDAYAFELAPLFWGDSGMDVPFADREALVDQWGPESRGTLTATEWEEWLREARTDDRFGDDELDALARELPTSDGLLTRLRRALRR
ncbi:hypothetical protein DMJ13_10115 [halophilic archaeon]|nr:hypothetical protein DMJ13_10115 [halophilic archaeon]